MRSWFDRPTMSGIGWLSMSGGEGLTMSGNKKAAKLAHPERVEGGGLPYERRMRLPRVETKRAKRPMPNMASTVVRRRPRRAGGSRGFPRQGWVW